MTGFMKIRIPQVLISAIGSVQSTRAAKIGHNIAQLFCPSGSGRLRDAWA